MIDDAAKKLAEILQYNKDQVGKPSRSARPGDTVKVTLGKNSGIIDAIAGTIIKGGQDVAVVKTPNGPVAIQGQTGGSLGIQTIINEIWEEEKPKPNPKNIKNYDLLTLVFYKEGEYGVNPNIGSNFILVDALDNILYEVNDVYLVPGTYAIDVVGKDWYLTYSYVDYSRPSYNPFGVGFVKPIVIVFIKNATIVKYVDNVYDTVNLQVENSLYTSGYLNIEISVAVNTVGLVTLYAIPNSATINGLTYVDIVEGYTNGVRENNVLGVITLEESINNSFYNGPMLFEAGNTSFVFSVTSKVFNHNHSGTASVILDEDGVAIEKTIENTANQTIEYGGIKVNLGSTFNSSYANNYVTESHSASGSISIKVNDVPINTIDILLPDYLSFTTYWNYETFSQDFLNKYEFVGLNSSNILQLIDWLDSENTSDLEINIYFNYYSHNPNSKIDDIKLYEQLMNKYLLFTYYDNHNKVDISTPVSVLSGSITGPDTEEPIINGTAYFRTIELTILFKKSNISKYDKYTEPVSILANVSGLWLGCNSQFPFFFNPLNSICDNFASIESGLPSKVPLWFNGVTTSTKTAETPIVFDIAGDPGKELWESVNYNNFLSNSWKNVTELQQMNFSPNEFKVNSWRSSFYIKGDFFYLIPNIALSNSDPETIKREFLLNCFKKGGKVNIFKFTFNKDDFITKGVTSIKDTYTYTFKKTLNNVINILETYPDSNKSFIAALHFTEKNAT